MASERARELEALAVDLGRIVTAASVGAHAGPHERALRAATEIRRLIEAEALLREVIEEGSPIEYNVLAPPECRYCRKMDYMGHDADCAWRRAREYLEREG